MSSRWPAVAGLVVVAFVGACSTPLGEAPTGDPAATTGVGRPAALDTEAAVPAVASGTMALPPTAGAFDYQLGGAYTPADDVTVVVRDRAAPPDPDRYSICYVNAFQTQPDEADRWRGANAELLLLGADGEPVEDQAWPGEFVLDTATDATRARLVAIVGEWIAGCADDGFDAAELDNLDSYVRFDGLSEDGTVTYARALVDIAQAAGLAVAQKNTPELLGRLSETGFDFAIVEECNQQGGCDDWAAAFDGRVWVVEYDPAGLAAACESPLAERTVLRDVDLAPADATGHVRETC